MPSDKVRGISSGHPDEPYPDGTQSGNTLFHHSFLVIFQEVTAPQAVTTGTIQGRVENSHEGLRVDRPAELDESWWNLVPAHRSFLLVAFDVGVEIVIEVVAEGLPELHQVLDRVGALPLRVLPLLLRDVREPRQARPVGLDEPALERVAERLLGGAGLGVPMAGTGARCLRFVLLAHRDLPMLFEAGTRAPRPANG